MSSWMLQKNNSRKIRQPPLLISVYSDNIINTNNNITSNNTNTNTNTNNNTNNVVKDITITCPESITQNFIDMCLNKYKLTEFSNKGKYVAVMLESRFFESIKTLLIQISRFLNKEWSVILFVTEDVYDNYIKIVNELNNNIQVKILNEKLSSQIDYNNILLKKSFWEMFINFEKVLIFQTDTMIFKYGIDFFLEYDYIGAPWSNDLNLITLVGNGGLSLRSPSKIIYCLDNIKKIKINNYKYYKENINKLKNHPEDIFFSFAMKKFNFKLPTVNIAKKFSIESVEHNYGCFGSHQLEKFNNELYTELLQNSIVPYFYNTTHNNIQNNDDKYINDEISNYFYNKNGVHLILCINEDYHIHENINWIGILDIIPCDEIKFINKLKNKLAYCKGFFTLSNYIRIYLEELLRKTGCSHIPIDVVYQPIKSTNILFNINNIDKINTIVNIGNKMQKNYTIFKINTTLQKSWIIDQSRDVAMSELHLECNYSNVNITNLEIENVNIIQINYEELNNILVNNFVIIDFHNIHVNKLLINCIFMNIPCLVIDLPIVREYIGNDYPLLFKDIQDLEQKLENKQLFINAYNYLLDRPYLKDKYTVNNFISDILNSNITKKILYIN